MFFLLATLFFGLLALFAVGTVFKLLFWIVAFPIRLFFKLLFGLGGLLLGVIMVPVVLVALAVGLIAALVAGFIALLLPLLPVILLGLVGWGIYKGASRRPTAAPL